MHLANKEAVELECRKLDHELTILVVRVQLDMHICRFDVYGRVATMVIWLYT